MRTDVIAKLAGLGIEVSAHDYPALDIGIKKSEDFILNYCNLEEIPEQLYFTAVSMAAGEFLFEKNNSGQLDIDFERAVKQIQEGDIRVDFSEERQSPREQFALLTERLLKPDLEQLIAFRRMRW